MITKNLIIFQINFLISIKYLSEKFSSSAMDVLLEVAMFRNDLDQTFLVMFVCLQFTKTFHWIIQKRIDHVSIIDYICFLISKKKS